VKNPVLAAALAAVLLCGSLLTGAAPAHAQKSAKYGAKPAARKKTTAHRRTSSERTSDAARREAAYRRLKDYNYVKSMSPYAGSPNKWGPKW
jgi:hypothetical protein